MEGSTLGRQCTHLKYTNVNSSIKEKMFGRKQIGFDLLYHHNRQEL